MLLVAALVGLFFLPTPWSVIAVVVAAFIEVAEVAFWLWLLSRYRVWTGVEGMIGERAVVVDPTLPLGRVRLRGELWNARSEVRLEIGARARVTAVDGLTLVVEPESGDEPPAERGASKPRAPWRLR